MTSEAVKVSVKSAPPLSAGGYRRQARRLRHHFRDDLSALHLSLRALAERRDAVNDAPQMPHRGTTRVFVRVPQRPSPARMADGGRAFGRRDFFGDEGVARPDPAARVLHASPEAVNELATEVQFALSGGALRHGQRLALLRVAGRLGVDRFEASLIMAAMEHRQPAADRVKNARTATTSASVVPWVVLVLVLQGLVGALAWWHLRG